MINLETSKLKLNFRGAALGLAALLAIHALWVLVPELMRPGFGIDTKFPLIIPARDLNSFRFSTNTAAALGFVRGDLWSERVLVDASSIVGDPDSSASSLKQQSFNDVRAAAEQALSLRPLDSRVWLVLATITSQSTPQSALAKEQIKMSYYTGPNDKAVIDRRLRSVVRFQALDDADLREVVRREIRTILLRVPELRPAITAAYDAANENDRAFIEATVSATDPNFATSLRAARQ